MKNTIIFLIAWLMCFNLFSQKKVYDKDNGKKNYRSEDTDISFARSSIQIPRSESAELVPLMSMIPSAIDLGFKIAGNVLENRVKKFSGEYSVQRSYLDAAYGYIPDIRFYRTVTLEKNEEPALEISIVAIPIKGSNSLFGFVYSIESFNLFYSKAISRGGTLDYTIEIKPTFIVNGEKKSQELFPITISSIGFGNSAFNDPTKHRTDIIPLPKDGFLAEIGIKIIETNPAKIRPEKIIAAITEYKDDAKTIINNFLPKEKNQDKVNEAEGGARGNENNEDGNQPLAAPEGERNADGNGDSNEGRNR